MKKFIVSKVPKSLTFTVTMTKGDLIPAFDSKEQAQVLADTLQQAVIDFNEGRSWLSGGPRTPGIHLVDVDGKFTVVKFNEKGEIETASGKPISLIIRSMKLQD